MRYRIVKRARFRHIAITKHIRVEHVSRNGIPHVITAVPYLRVNGIEIQAYETSCAVSSVGGYVDTAAGRVPVSALRKHGIGYLGRDTNGMSLMPRGGISPLAAFDPKLCGYDHTWRIHCAEYVEPTADDKEICITHHLTQLIRLGVSGGVTSPRIMQHVPTIQRVLLDYVAAHPDAHVLVVALGPTLYKDFFVTCKHERIHVRDGFKADSAMQKEYDIALLCDGGNHVIKGGGTADKSYAKLKRRVTLLLMHTEHYLYLEHNQRRMKQLCIDIDAAYAHKSVYKVRNAERRPMHEAINLVLKDIDAKVGARYPITKPQRGLRTRTGFMYEKFTKEAATTLYQEAEPAPFVPFTTFTPLYSTMSQKQLRFYRYWRQIPEAWTESPVGIGYVMLYCIEMVNGVCVDAAVERISAPRGCIGLAPNITALVALYNALSHTGDALADYILSALRYIWIREHGLERIDKLFEVTSHMPSSPFNINLYLGGVRNVPLDAAKVRTLLCATGTFNASTKEAVWAGRVVDVIVRLDAVLRKQYDMGVLGILSPSKTEPFALLLPACSDYMQFTEQEIFCYDYHGAGVLADYLVALVDYVKWRVTKNKRAMPEGLDDATRRIIDSITQDEAVSTTKSAVATSAAVVEEEIPEIPLTVDFDNVARLMSESDEVLKMYQASLDSDAGVDITHEPTTEEVAEAFVEQPPVTEEDNLFAPSQCELLRIVQSGDNVAARLREYAKAEGRLLSVCIDEINELYEQRMGDILIDTDTYELFYEIKL